MPKVRCDDGHFVRSSYEARVDNFLFAKNIKHVYECNLPTEQMALCDWYLPEYNAFLEFWGLEGDAGYKSRMDEKIKIYEENKLNLISIFDADLDNFESVFYEQLNRLGVENYRSDEYKVKIGNVPSFVAIDFETACNERNSACSLGIVLVENNKILTKKEYLIQPPNDRFSFTSYHGLTWNDVKDAPKFPEIWDEVQDILRVNNKIVAHNASFDKSVLKALLNFYSLESPDFDFVCTIAEAKRCMKLDNYKLETVCSKLGIKLLHHNALSDANAAAEIMIHVNSMAEKNTNVDQSKDQSKPVSN